MKNIVNEIVLSLGITILASCAFVQPAAGRKSEVNEDHKAASIDSVSHTEQDLKENGNSMQSAKFPKSDTQNPLTVENGNIKSLELSAKNNGTMIKIETSQPFSEKDIGMSITQDNFINITIYKGKFDKHFPDNLKTIGEMSDISYYTFPESAQLIIKLKNKVASKSLFLKPDKIIISLFESE